MNKSLAAKVIGICLIFLLIGVFVGYGAAPSLIQTISSGIVPGAPSYTVYSVGGVVYAKDQNGYNEFSGTDTATVINDVMSLSPSSVLLTGSFSIESPGIQLSSNVKCVADGTFEIASGANTAAFQAIDKSDITLDLTAAIISGQGTLQSSYGQGVLFQRIDNFRIIGGSFVNCRDSGINIINSTNGEILYPYIDVANIAGSGGIGLSYGCRYVSVVGAKVYNAETIGICSSGGGGLAQYNKIINCHVDVTTSSTAIGISVDGENEYAIVSGNTVLGQPNADAINLEGWGDTVNKAPLGCILTNNRVFYSRIADAGVSPTYPCIANQIIGNFVRDSSMGVYVANANNTLVLGNTFWNCSTTIAYYQSYNYTVANNVEYP